MLESSVAAFLHLVDASNGFFADVLDGFGVRPRHYAYIYPPSPSTEEIESLFDQGLFPKLSDLAPAITYCILLSLARFVLQNYLIKPFGIWCMQIKERPFQAIEDIEYNLPAGSTLPDIQKVEAYCKLSGRSVESLTSYLRARQAAAGVRKKMVKFVEAFWRAIFYTAFCVLGYRALFTPEVASWVYDTNNCWVNWPRQVMPAAVKFYYHIELGCYVHQLLWTEVNRSDAVEMIAHHFITIFLVSCSYLTGFWRVGSVILLIHDVADVLLETAKVFNYSSQPAHRRWIKAVFVDPIFALFAVTFFVSRLVVYPRWVLYTVMVEGYNYFQCDVQACNGLFFFPILLALLQGLHIFWFYLIARMIYQLLTGQMDGDVRSDDENDGVEYHGDTDEKDEQKKKDQ